MSDPPARISQEGRTALHIALAAGDVDCVRLLVREYPLGFLNVVDEVWAPARHQPLSPHLGSHDHD